MPVAPKKQRAHGRGGGARPPPTQPPPPPPPRPPPPPPPPGTVRRGTAGRQEGALAGAQRGWVSP
ncbi:hypothetical protein, partial [Nocardia brasiliensis]|uniref:hypothetical protein n=1 Tax=Nocardia brasiliensis TaxID=37326 RepID=UPI003D775BBF